jgi:predicted DNA repair protein MutK
LAGTGLLALLDDITTILDDVAALSKVAAQKTAGIAGDDLAVNTQGLVGLDPARELPIVGKVALGSALNKVVLVPLALALPAAAITPLLVVGGTFLCYEGVHKVFHKADHKDEAHAKELIAALQTGPDALAKVEAQKVRQAIITDIVLSAEIVAVALGAVADAPFATKAAVLSLVSGGMTVAIYGLVAGIVKLDDLGLHLQQRGGRRAWVGQQLVDYTPALMRVISVVGTAAMFLVGGGIVLHGFHADEWIEHQIEAITHLAPLVSLLTTLATLAIGVALGALALAVVEPIKGLVKRVRAG